MKFLENVRFRSIGPQTPYTMMPAGNVPARLTSGGRFMKRLDTMANARLFDGIISALRRVTHYGIHIM
ncbi:hypothetical protein ACY0L5_006488, partial [Klebsiella michiganensis]